MSLKVDSLYNASDFTNLKTRVKSEMQRRNGYGSLTQYAGSTYDYTNPPKVDDIPKLEHFSKIRDVMSKINTDKVGISNKNVDNTIPAMIILEANMTTFESQPRGEINNNDCAGACTGMCVSQCTTTCIGSCTGGCSGCGSSCSGTCVGTCDTTCTGTCNNTCNDTCQNTCKDTCTGSCTGGCSGCGSSCGSDACSGGCFTYCLASSGV